MYRCYLDKDGFMATPSITDGLIAFLDSQSGDKAGSSALLNALG